MANKYRKIQFRFTKELIIMVCVLVALIVATIILQQPTKKEKFVSKWQEAGSSIQENTLFKEETFKQLDKQLENNEKVVVLFVTPEDKNSVSLFDEVLNNAAVYDVEVVYIIDCADYLGDRKTDSKLDESLKALENTYKVSLEEAPALWLFNNGSLVAELNYDLIEEASGSYSEAVKRVLVYNK